MSDLFRPNIPEPVSGPEAPHDRLSTFNLLFSYQGVATQADFVVGHLLLMLISVSLSAGLQIVLSWFSYRSSIPDALIGLFVLFAMCTIGAKRLRDLDGPAILAPLIYILPSTVRLFGLWFSPEYLRFLLPITIGQFTFFGMLLILPSRLPSSE